MCYSAIYELLPWGIISISSKYTFFFLILFVGKDFLARRQVFFFTKTAVTRKLKVEISIPRSEMDRLYEGYKWAIKFGILWQKTEFRADNRVFGPKTNIHFLVQTMFWPRPGKVGYHYFSKFWVFLEKKTEFWSKNCFSA